MSCIFFLLQLSIEALSKNYVTRHKFIQSALLCANYLIWLFDVKDFCQTRIILNTVIHSYKIIIYRINLLNNKLFKHIVSYCNWTKTIVGFLGNSIIIYFTISFFSSSQFLLIYFNNYRFIYCWTFFPLFISSPVNVFYSPFDNLTYNLFLQWNETLQLNNCNNNPNINYWANFGSNLFIYCEIICIFFSKYHC